MTVFPRKLRRDLLIAGGLEVTGNTTLTGAVTAAGGAAITGTLGVSAVKSGIICSTGGYVADKVQTLTDYAALTDTGGSSKAGYQAIIGYGVTAITVTGTSGTTAGSTANMLVFKLNPPIKAGVVKEIYVTGSSASTKTVKIRTATSTHTFFGSTQNAIGFTTAVNNLGYGWPIKLRALSTTQWALGALPGVKSTACFTTDTTA